jgi:hypothetical protein
MKLQRFRAKRTVPPPRLPGCNWEERRLELTHRVGEQAEEALRRTAKEIKSGKAADAKNMVTALAISVDKAQLLTGSSTNWQEYASRKDLERRAKELDELARRRAERLQRT